MDVDISKKYDREEKSSSLKGWHEMAEDFSYHVRLENLRQQIVEDRKKKGLLDKKEPLFTHERWLAVKHVFEDNMTILNLKDLAEDEERVKKLKFDRLNHLLANQALSLEDAFLNDSYCFHFVMLAVLLRH